MPLVHQSGEDDTTDDEFGNIDEEVTHLLGYGVLFPWFLDCRLQLFVQLGLLLFELIPSCVHLSNFSFLLFRYLTKRGAKIMINMM